MPKKIISVALILAGAIAIASCAGGNTNSASTGSPSTQSSPSQPARTGFEADLDYVRKGQFTYVWVISRRDGKPIDKDDATFLRSNAPQVVDWVTTEEGRKVIAGTNFDLAKGNLDLLKKRFVVEDYTGR